MYHLPRVYLEFDFVGVEGNVTVLSRTSTC
jgi:hypothetical protein